MRWFISLSAYHTPAYHMKPTNLPCEKPFPSSTMHSFKPVPTPHRVLGGVRCTTIPRSRQLLERKLASAAHSNAESNGKGLDCPPSPAVDSSNMPSNPYNWTFDSKTPAKLDPKVQDIPVDLIRRPLGRTRKNGEEAHAGYLVHWSNLQAFMKRGVIR